MARWRGAGSCTCVPHYSFLEQSCTDESRIAARQLLLPFHGSIFSLYLLPFITALTCNAHPTVLGSLLRPHRLGLQHPRSEVVVC